MEDNYKQRGLRRRLVDILIEKGIQDKKILNAFSKVPRHQFFPPEFLSHAYQDKAFPIGEGQTISQPYTVAFQTQLLNISANDKVLEIGTGSGYQCAILKALGAEVFTIEFNNKLFENAKKLLRKMGHSAHFFCGDGSMGLKRHAPYSAILVTAGAPTIPKALIDQLGSGGRLVIPVGNRKVQQMVRITRTSENKLIKEEFANFSFVPLVGEDGWDK